MMNFIAGAFAYALNAVVAIVILLFSIVWIPLTACTRLMNILLRKLIGADPPK